MTHSRRFQLMVSDAAINDKVNDEAVIKTTPVGASWRRNILSSCSFPDRSKFADATLAGFRPQLYSNAAFGLRTRSGIPERSDAKLSAREIFRPVDRSPMKAVPMSIASLAMWRRLRCRYYVGVKSKPMQKDFEIKPSVHAMWETRVQFPTRDTSRLGRKVARYEDRTTCSRAGRALEHVEHVVLNV
ncbi:unnamed protein product, partial [Iphiclides podalirius]